jgi:predicted esterase
MHAFPIAGGAPYRLLPRGHAPTAPVYALHGSDDPVIDVAYARRAVAAFREDGARAELHELPGGHVISPEMRADLYARVGAVLDGAP